MGIERIKMPDGSYMYPVSRKQYKYYENIRNYVLRTKYEKRIPLCIAKCKAQCLFDIEEEVVNTALLTWKSWCFMQNGVYMRHRPIELFIKDHKEKLNKEKKQKEEEKRIKELKKFYGDENGQVTINTRGVD